jgi:hypothetical protein
MVFLHKSAPTRNVQSSALSSFCDQGCRKGLNVADPPKKPGQSGQHATFWLSRSPKPVDQDFFGHSQLCRSLPIRLGGFYRVPLQSLEDLFLAH